MWYDHSAESSPIIWTAADTGRLEGPRPALPVVLREGEDLGSHFNRFVGGWQADSIRLGRKLPIWIVAGINGTWPHGSNSETLDAASSMGRPRSTIPITPQGYKTMKHTIALAAALAASFEVVLVRWTVRGGN